MADSGPEDEVIASIWASGGRGGLLTVEAGEVALPVTAPIVWFPFLVVVVVGWIGAVVILPTAIAERLIDLTFGWFAVAGGDVSVDVWLSLGADIVGLMAAFLVYRWAYGWLIGSLLRRSSR